MKKLVILAFILNLTFNASASIPESMPQTVYDGIVSQVMTDAGHYDAVKVEEAISQWLLDQPVPDNDGLLIESGSCSDCGADSQGTIAELPQPRNVKIKAKKNNNGSYTTTYKIKWKRPQDLANDSPYAFSHYNVYVSKDGESYETFEVTPKIKRNGRPKKRNKIKFKESQEGHYTVQVQAVYVDSSDQSKKDSNKAQKSIIYSASGWTEPKLYSLGKFDLHVSDLSGKLKDCVMGAGYGNNTLLKIFTKLDCRSSELVDSDIIQIENFNNLRSLIIDDNTDVTDISPLKNLAYLTLLSLEGNTGINLNFNKIIELEDLYLGRMGLTQLPNLSEMLDLEFLDLSNNNISGGFNKLPDSLTVLVLDDNKIKSCLGLDGITIETISLKGEKITSFENCSLVDGLSFFSIYDTPNLIGTHNIDNFSGFCSLELDKTGIKKLEGSRPIRSLTLTTNENLKNINVIKTGALEIGNSYPDLIPSYVSLDGSPNIKCENLFEVQQIWSDNTKLDMTVPVTTTVDGIQKDSPVCPVINYDFIFNKEASCKANKITNLSAIRSNSKIKYALTWDQTDHSKWGITSYQIRTNYVEGGEEIISTIPADFNFPLYLENSAQQPSFEVRACKTNDSDINNITTTCSNWSDSSWSPGLSKISSLEYNWIDQNNNLFELDFIYPQGDIAHESNVPDYFEVLSGLDINDSLLHTVNFISGLNDYTSQAIDLDNLLSREFRVRACKNPTSDHPKKCGRSKLIRVLEEITSNPSSTPAVPTLLSQPSQNNLNQGFIKFNVSSSQDVEYFDVVETQPVPVSDGAPIENLDNKKFYTVKAQGNQGHFDLIRKVNGKHYFRVSACKVAQGSIQGKKSHCSEPLELGFADNDPTNDNDWKIQRTVLNSALNNSSVDENLIDLDWKWITCNDIYDSNNRLDNGIGCIPTTIANEEDIIGGNNYIKTRLKWKYRNSSAQQSNITPPDYFHLSKVQQSDNGENIKAIDSPSTPNNNYNSIINMCIAKQPAIYDVDNPNTISPKYAKQQIIVPNDNSPSPPGVLSTFDTQKACKGGIRVSEDGLWKIKACYSGIGCTSGKEIDILADVQDQNDYENRGDIGDIRGREALYDPIVEEPAPDNLQSGLWWNPHQAGTGWYFHWKNNSTNPNRELKDSYNLLAHWIIYRKFNNGTWSPIWVYADMSLNQDNDNGDQIYSGQIYYSHIVGGLKTEQGLGTIKVLINPDQQNYRAKVELDIDSDNGLLTQDSINYDFAGDAGDYFEIDFGETGDEYDSITLPLEVFGIRLIGEDPDDTNTTGGVSNTTRFGLKNDIDHYSGLWEYEGSNDADDAIIAIWQKHNLEIMNFFIYDNAGQPFWLMSQTCGDPCSVPVSGYFDQYINAKTGEHEFGIEESGTFNFNTKVDGGFNPLGYKPDEPWHEVEFLAKAGRLLADDTNTTLQPYKQGKFWLDINAPISNANRHVTRQLGVEPNLDGPYSSLLTMNKIANINHIGFNLKDYRGDIQFDDEEENIIATTCDPNVTGYCTVDFNWYTESSTNGLPLKPYYKFGDMESFEPLTSGLEGLDCTTTPPSGNFVDSYKCMLLTEGEYEFQLKREKYSGTGYTIIAESAKLTSIACDDNCNRDESYVDQSQLPFIGPDSIGPDEDGNGDGDGILELSDLPTAPDSSSQVGTTQGSFSVSNNGASMYSIPIMTAPASGGLAPSFSINYNSQSATSSLGKGWSIGGYSIINRCSQTYDQDYDEVAANPLVLNVNFSDSDRFCVDGKRLFLESETHDYGEDGAVYKTEINDFTKYTSTGSQGGSPTCFIAQHKNGNITYYGNCDIGSNEEASALVDSALTADPADNPAFAWAQSRMIDVSGNYYDVSYYSGKVAGTSDSEPTIEFYPKIVYYSANTNAGQSYKDEIEFVYDDDVDSDEIIGNAISTNPNIKHLVNNKRLIRIDSKSKNQFLRSYDLGYSNYPNIPDSGIKAFNVLTSISECTDSSQSVCFEPTLFSWDTGSVKSIGTTVIDTSEPYIEFPSYIHDNNDSTIEDYVVTPFDINGDGIQDYAIQYKNNVPVANQITQIAIAKQDGTGFEVQDITIPGGVAKLNSRLIDINGDGFNDIATRTEIYLWNGTYYDEPISLGFTADKYFDMDGDGLPEAVELITTGSGVDITESILIYKNNIGLNVDHNLLNAFGDPQVFNLNVSEVELVDGGLIIPDAYLFDSIDIASFFDDDGDGISEILLEIKIEACPDGVQHPTIQGVIFPCQTSGSERIFQWAIARLVQISASDWEYSIKTLEPTTSCSSFDLCGMGITQPTFIDFNQDGAQEMCYVEHTYDNPSRYFNDWRCFETVKGNYRDNSIFNKSFDVDSNSNEYFNQTSYEDYNGDGFIDLMFSDGHDDNSKWSVIYTNSSDGNINFETVVRETQTIAGRGENSDIHNNYDNFELDKHLFIDINNDSIKDSLLFKYDPSDTKIKAYATLGTITGGNINSKDKIVSITEGLGNHIDITYKPMTNTEVYTRDNNSVNAWFGSGKTPIYDFTSQMSLVSNYQIKMPAYKIDDNNQIDFLSGTSSRLLIEDEYTWTKSIDYHYYGAKIQAGGRGFLGFKTIEVFDADTRILTQNSFHQEFPFTGQTFNLVSSLLNVADSPDSLRSELSDKTIPCWVNNSCDSNPVIPEPDLCLSHSGIICDPLNRGILPERALEISTVNTTWQHKDIITGTKTTKFIYPEFITTDQNELDGTDKIGRTHVVNTYDEPSFYGNLSKIIEYSYDKNSLTPTLTKTTDIVYNYYTTDGEYVVDKPYTSEVTYSRPSDEDVDPYPDQKRKTTFTYDDFRRIKTEKRTSGDNSTTNVTKTFVSRDSFGNSKEVKITATSLSGDRKVEKTYDTQGRHVVNSILDDQIQQKIILRDKFGNPTIVENQQGIRTLSKYDDFGRLFYQINETGQWSQIEYVKGASSYCNQTDTAYYTITTSSAPTNWQCYDVLNRETRNVTQGFKFTNKIYVDTHYDSAGRVLETSIPKFSIPNKEISNDWLRSAYDETGRVLKLRNSEGKTTNTSYSALSKTVTNARNFSTISKYNMLGEIVSVEDAKGNFITYGYDDIGNQTSIDGPLTGTQDEIITKYDDFDNVTQIIDPNLGTWNYKYNLIGELLYQRDAEGNCTVNEYDLLGRLSKRHYRIEGGQACDIDNNPNNEENTWTYDNVSTSEDYGLLTKEQNQNVIINYYYDNLARIESTSTNITGFNQYIQETYYDQYSRPLASVDATDRSVRYDYNSQGYQFKTTDQNSGVEYQTIVNRDAFGNIQKVISGNNVVTTNGYDNLGRTKSIFTSHGNTYIQNLEYIYDSVGNLDTRIDYRNLTSLFHEEFTYDSLNRLEIVKAKTGDVPLTPTMNFDYDKGGRITNFNGHIYNYNTASLHGVDDIDFGTKNFVYDNNGNQTNSDNRIIGYTPFNKTKSIVKGNNQAYFEYDTNNVRIKRTDKGSEGDETTYYIGNVEIITDDSTNSTRSKRYIADAVVTYYETTGIEEIKYLHKDHLGSVQTVTDGVFNTQTTQHLSYDAYGRRRDAEVNTGYLNFNPIATTTKNGFTGQEHIDQLGVINYNARLYDPELGIMLQADTIIPDGPVTQSINRYSYVFNNPLSYTDPSGHVPLLIPFIVKAVGWTGAIWGAIETSVAIQKVAHLVSIGELTVGEAIIEGAHIAAFEIGTTALGGVFVKTADKLIPEHLKQKALEFVIRGDRNDIITANNRGTQSSLSDDDIVVTGGANHSAENLKKRTGDHPDGVNGFSGEASSGACLGDLCTNVKHNQIGVSTVGEVRKHGGDVVPTDGLQSPTHVTITNIEAEDASKLFSPSVKNPIPRPDRAVTKREKLKDKDKKDE